jgi:thiamine biosynthesis lipoprotein
VTARIGRRRFIRVAAAAASLPALGLGREAGARAPLLRWEGTALGAHASLVLAHPDREAAERLVARCVDEIARLEAVFSLYRPDSALTRLNEAGELREPPLDLVVLLEESLRLSRLSHGAFDVTVQPLWQLYAEHFAAAHADPAGPAPEAIAAARGLVDWRAVEVAPTLVRLARPGMAVTLNGIAQGYVTDRVADLLREAGMTQVLVDLGEIRALGGHPDGRPWRVGLNGAAPREIELVDLAVATSAGSGTAFDRSGRFHHLFDPATGSSANHWRSVSVTAPRATVADALSTALSIVVPAAAGEMLAAAAPARAWLTDGSGETRVLSALGA